MTNDAPVILITGASAGIGAATARLFAKQGYRVVLAARRLERLEVLAIEIEAQGGQALPVQCDMQRMDDIQSLASTTIEHYGQIDVLFNNAGFGRLDWLEKLDPGSDIKAQIQVNLLGLILMTQAVLPHMIARRSGHIINMASMAGLVATPTYTVYAASKFAVRGFSEALRREVGIYDICVSTICPGGVKTDFAKIARVKRSTRISTPKKLALTGEDVAQEVWGLARRPRRVLVIPRVMNFVVWANSLLPGLIDLVIQRRFVQRERLTDGSDPS
jgi:short-subunit dehydrogenase